MENNNQNNGGNTSNPTDSMEIESSANQNTTNPSPVAQLTPEQQQQVNALLGSINLFSPGSSPAVIHQDSTSNNNNPSSTTTATATTLESLPNNRVLSNISVLQQDPASGSSSSQNNNSTNINSNGSKPPTTSTSTGTSSSSASTLEALDLSHQLASQIQQHMQEQKKKQQENENTPMGKIKKEIEQWKAENTYVYYYYYYYYYPLYHNYH